jgi:hypothetical protein
MWGNYLQVRPVKNAGNCVQMLQRPSFNFILDENWLKKVVIFFFFKI